MWASAWALVIPFVQAVSPKQHTQSKKKQTWAISLYKTFFHKKKMIMDGITVPILAVNTYNSKNKKHDKTTFQKKKTK